jgi:capsule polysaccharide modification protein KpsS
MLFISFEPSIIKANKFHSSKGDACNVENFSEYEDMVRKVLKLQPMKAITVFVDMKDINHAAKKVCTSAILGDI